MIGLLPTSNIAWILQAVILSLLEISRVPNIGSRGHCGILLKRYNRASSLILAEIVPLLSDLLA